MVQADETLMKLLQPKYGTIYRLLILSGGDYVVLESLKGGSMLYRLDQDLKVVWESDFKTRMLCNMYVAPGDEVRIYDGYGEGRLNLLTGEVTDWVVTR